MSKPFVKYFSQKNAWSDTAVFRQWFSEVFLSHIRTKTPHPVEWVMDNCGLHGSDLTDISQQGLLFLLSPNCKSIHQPMDLDVIAAWKTNYKKHLLEVTMAGIEDQDQLQQMNSRKKGGMNGLQENHGPHMFDVTRLARLN